MTSGHAMKVPAVKTLMRKSYKVAVGLRSVASAPFTDKSAAPRVFYGGARVGDAGGALVKVSRMNEFFPEHRWSYNLVYCLSNTPYLQGYALRLLKKRGIPIVLNQSGAFYAGWYNGDWRKRNVEISQAYHLADYVFWQSEFSRQSVEKFLGPRNGKGEILYNAVDTKVFHPQPQTRESGETGFRFLVSGKTDPHLAYRLEAALSGLARARQIGLEAKLVVAGVMVPETEKSIKKSVEEFRLTGHVSFYGPYTQASAPSLYSSCDAYVLLTHNDVCPNSAIEAMACGLPIIHTSTGGVSELVGDAGTVIETAENWDTPSIPDAEAVAQAMIAVSEGQKRLSQRARQRAVENFDILPWIQRHGEVFDSLLAERK